MLRIARGFDGEGPFFSILIPGLFAQLAPDVEAGQRYHGKQQHQEHNTAAALIVALHLAPLYIELVVDLIAQGGEHLFLGFHFLRGICDLTVLQVLVQDIPHLLHGGGVADILRIGFSDVRLAHEVDVL